VGEQELHQTVSPPILPSSVSDCRSPAEPGQGRVLAGRLSFDGDDPVANLPAVDLGLRTGLALYGPDARLRWYRSQHFANRGSLRRGVYGLLDAEPDMAHLVLEGGGPIADIWVREAERREITVHRIAAEAWRGKFFRPKDQRGRDRRRLTTDGL
jgi:hypothetical protein